MLKTIQSIVKPKRPTVAGCVAAQAAMDAKVAALLPKELQNLTIEQWRTFVTEIYEPIDQPQNFTYTFDDGSIAVIAGVVPPLTLVEGSSNDGYAVFSDKLGNRRSVGVTKPSLSVDS
jgi:hypothetical protein